MGVIDWLRGRVRDRDGQAAALESGAQEATGARPARPAWDAGTDLRLAVTTKVLDGWLANRRQTLVPHTLNFRALAEEETELLLGLMAAAARADGAVDAREARQLPQALALAGAGEPEARRLGALLEGEEPPLGPLLLRAAEAGLGSHAYAAALLAINRRGRANRAFLDFLAARLGLSPELAASLERRYRA
ncbi:DUF533 domain-containing protein [Rubellimicrobium roseum]|uniref:Tellurite resistance TerB family protein n=1 Tax=Rubellimicrobium roseum TaxID=687525 RepID=A0A5C4NJJ0_9RHOB|nr:DUF533 domain-containing protein [Rubellimicrobium roseum]TNC74954.1 tellurite resistance TerB family protein [Rubellimicrobium roseum]